MKYSDGFVPLLILIIVLVSSAVGGSIYFYRKYHSEQEINKNLENLSDQQKIQAGADINVITSVSSQLNKNISNKSGIPISPVNDQEVEKTVVDATIKASNVGIKTGMQNMVGAAEIYFGNHKNYGVSNLQNACLGSDLDNFLPYLSIINKYSKTLAKCAVSTNFPTKTFTIVVPSLVENGLYCTDQNGFAGVIVNTDSQFIAGIKCK